MPAASSTTRARWGRLYTVLPFSTVFTRAGLSAFHCERRWWVLARNDGRTRLAFAPTTGRTHQLRTHAAHPLGLGCAIAGDALYGDVTTSPRLLLHARELCFDHPRTGERLTFSCPAPF